MSNPVADAARQEASRLKAALLESDVANIFKDFLRAQQVILMYEADAVPSPMGNAVRRFIPRVRPEPQGDSEAARVIAAAKAYLERVKRRAPSGEIMDAIIKAGVGIAGDKKYWSSRVSAHLSSDRAKKIFNNVKGQGYGLIAATYAEAQKSANGVEAH